MMRLITEFLTDDSGAITVDWVVLTAAVVGLMFAALTVFFTGVTDHADLTASTLSTLEIKRDY